MMRKATGLRRLAWLLLALVMTGTSIIMAQSEAPPPENDDEKVREAAPAETVEIDPNAIPPLPSPDDYQASEQISEDLSVSFPVDI